MGVLLLDGAVAPGTLHLVVCVLSENISLTIIQLTEKLICNNFDNHWMNEACNVNVKQLAASKM